jgi:hypothetical protein
MPQWLPKILKRIRERAAAREVMFTLKALRELATLDSGLDEEDACEILANLTSEDSAGRIESATTREWMYLFKPQFGVTVLYLKLILRGNCVVISFHEDEDDSS